ncbi:MAG: OmpA family protein [Myxococcales bacterium]|nr:OmpA family protein [Myxococcales bacterium]
MRNARMAVACLLIGAVVTWAPRALAAPGQMSFELSSFRYAATAGGLLTVEGADIATHLKPRVGLQLGYAHRPLIYKGEGVEHDAVTGRLVGELVSSIGLWRRVELGISLPLVLYQAGDASAGVVAGEARRFGLGDLMLLPKVRLFSPGNWTLSLLAGVRLPTAQSDTLGGGGLAVDGRLLAGWRSGRWRVGLSAGYRVQGERRLLDLVVDDQLLFGVGARARLLASLGVIAEVTAATAASKPFGDIDTTPVQAMAGLRWAIGRSNFSLTAAGGPGIVPGFGAATAQVRLALTWDPAGVDRDGDGIRDRDDECPDVPEDIDGFQDQDGCPDPDNDNDGIPDAQDKCPNVPEDIDGFEDHDGCPDLDNDGDGIPDALDKCPNEPEDFDGYKDDDGCPDPDNDGDGIPDKLDKCPNQAETFNGVDDKDGCPEPDRDLDGILDDKDKCPDEPEDKNGIEDDDGCPDDPDGDGIPNSRDRCPNQPETFNGYQDDDGCPDDPTPKVVIKRDRIWTSEAIFFATDSVQLNSAARRLLRKMAKVLARAWRVKVVYVEGHADSRGPNDGEKYNQWLSFRRARAVVGYLHKQGVNIYKLRPIGWGMQRPWDNNNTRKGMARNRRVIFHVVHRSPRVRIEAKKRGRRTR